MKNLEESVTFDQPNADLRNNTLTTAVGLDSAIKTEDGLIIMAKPSPFKL